MRTPREPSDWQSKNQDNISERGRSLASNRNRNSSQILNLLIQTTINGITFLSLVKIQHRWHRTFKALIFSISSRVFPWLWTATMTYWPRSSNSAFLAIIIDSAAWRHSNCKLCHHLKAFYPSQKAINPRLKWEALFRWRLNQGLTVGSWRRLWKRRKLFWQIFNWEGIREP